MFIYDNVSLSSSYNNVLDQGFSENQNMNLFSNNFFGSVPLLDNGWKYVITRQVTDDSTIFTHVIQQSQKYMSIYFKWQNNRVPISSENGSKLIFNIT